MQLIGFHDLLLTILQEWHQDGLLLVALSGAVSQFWDHHNANPGQ